MGSPPFCTLIFCSVVFWTFFCEKSMNFQFGISYESNTSFFFSCFQCLVFILSFKQFNCDWHLGVLFFVCNLPMFAMLLKSVFSFTEFGEFFSFFPPFSFFLLVGLLLHVYQAFQYYPRDSLFILSVFFLCFRSVLSSCLLLCHFQCAIKYISKYFRYFSAPDFPLGLCDSFFVEISCHFIQYKRISLHILEHYSNSCFKFFII